MIKKVFNNRETEFTYIDWNGQNIQEIREFIGEEISIELLNYRTLLINNEHLADIGDCFVTDKFGHSFRIYSPEEFRKKFKYA